MKRLRVGKLDRPGINDELEYEKDEKSQDQGRSNVCYMPTVLLLSCLLITTLYLLRHDNKKLTSAENYIRQLKQNINDLEEEISSSQLRNKFADSSESSTSAAPISSCPNDLSTSKKQLSTWISKTDDIERQIQEMDHKATGLQDQINSLRTRKEQLTTQINIANQDKRILAKRLGIKMAGDRGA